jgi:hypothetical protein
MTVIADPAPMKASTFMVIALGALRVMTDASEPLQQ